MHRYPLKAATAFVAAAAVLFLMAAPSSATSNSGTVTGGTVFSNISPPISQPIGGGGSGACAGGPASSITLDLTGSAPNRTSQITSASFSLSSFTYSGNPYVLDLVADTPSSTGTVTGSSSPYNVSQSITLIGTISRETGTANCTPDVFTCEFELTVNLTGTVSTTSTIPSSNVVPAGSTTNLSGSNFPNTGVCGAPFTTLNSNLAGVNNLQVTF